ncbi:MAG: hypothetical protein FJY58_07720 [Betaproteobacteria bacterium]|nr:hypothetical protein [Betaproteobacteria bacterium]
MFTDKVERIEMCLARENQKILPIDVYAKVLAKRFALQGDTGLHLSDIGNNEHAVDVLLCNSSNEAEVVSGFNAFRQVKKGLILIKGYGKFNAPNCGEITTAGGMNVHCTLAGFGFVLALR